MPPNSVAPLAFYFFGDLLNDYTNRELISTISTMETFQKYIARDLQRQYSCRLSLPAKFRALRLFEYAHRLRPRGAESSYGQGKFAEEHFIKPYRTRLQWAQQQAFNLFQ